ncbi:MAG TPA: epoxyqueuosine reductase QueH [Thermodesulfobacteriaceae bacterium]|nr:epoxyqueuosine reductase QueH [Thermodesulfobacteriaceae bacterium]
MKLLLHTCCGPCTLYPLKALCGMGIQAYGFFHNPNIHPFREYERRIEAMETVAGATGLPMQWDRTGYGLHYWMDELKNKTDPSERCPVCFRIRLEATAQTAVELGFKIFSTTLLYSRYQRHDIILETGRSVASLYGIDFFYHNFRTGWDEGIRLSKEMEIYRQPYCGCIFSEAERYQKRAARLARRLSSDSSEDIETRAP